MALPDFVSPMLARSGAAFDSEQHLFEPKWDGFRALAFIEPTGVRVMSRRQNELTPRYPETDALRGLPVGTLLDGELVCIRNGAPDFEAMLTREQARGTRIRALMATHPVVFVAFDLLYAEGASVMDRPLRERRALLTPLVAVADDPRLVLSEGVTGSGEQFFEETKRLGLEGMVAKDLEHAYEPGKRSGAWTKVKETQRILCVILGYTVDDQGGLKSLVIGSNHHDGSLRCVGRVGSGLREVQREQLQQQLDDLKRTEPVVPCDGAGNWADPILYCTVRFLAWTSNGTLRAPVFDAMAEEA